MHRGCSEAIRNTVGCSSEVAVRSTFGSVGLEGGRKAAGGDSEAIRNAVGSGVESAVESAVASVVQKAIRCSVRRAIHNGHGTDPRVVIVPRIPESTSLRTWMLLWAHKSSGEYDHGLINGSSVRNSAKRAEEGLIAALKSIRSLQYSGYIVDPVLSLNSCSSTLYRLLRTPPTRSFSTPVPSLRRHAEGIPGDDRDHSSK